MSTEALLTRVLRALELHGCQPRPTGNGQYTARCPAHDDRCASLSISAGDDGRVLLFCHAGCALAEVLPPLGLEPRALFATRKRGRNGGGAQRQEVASYDYMSSKNELLYQAVRYDPKDFRFRRPDGHGGFVWNLKKIKRVLYGLPALHAADRAVEVYVVAGEKDVDRLAAAGILATTNPGGELKWRPAYNGTLRGRPVNIIPDNDPVGHKHAQQVAANLHGIAASVKLLELPGVAPKGDISDWLDAGHTAEELRELAERSPEWEPSTQRAAANAGSLRAVSREEMQARLARAVEPFGRWLHMPDLGPVHFALGTIAANRKAGDPVWGLIIAPPSYGKTEIINALSELPDTHTAATLTEASLLSGTPARERGEGATGGLLRVIGEFGILLLKDFGSILSQHHDTQAQTLAALREVFDGSWTRYVGTDGGRKLHWSGKLGILAGCTPTIDRRQTVMSAMGERFVLYRISISDDAEQGRAALAHIGKESAMRAELSSAVSGLFDGVDFDALEPRALSEDERERLVMLACFVVRCRSSVERDSHDREIDLIPDPEAPGRLTLVLARLLAGLDMIGLDRAAAWRIVDRVGLDSMPALKRRVIDILRDSETKLSTTTVALAAQYPTTTARRQLEELAAHGVCSREAGGKGKADEWQLTSWARVKLEAWTVPETPEGMKGEKAPLDQLQHTNRDFGNTPRIDHPNDPNVNQASFLERARAKGWGRGLEQEKPPH